MAYIHLLQHKIQIWILTMTIIHLVLFYIFHQFILSVEYYFLYHFNMLIIKLIKENVITSTAKIHT